MMHRRSSARRALAAVVALAAASVVLAACTWLPDPRESAPSPTPDTTGVSAELLPFYEQTLDWTGCGEGFDCTTVTAPLDWADPAAGEIDLALIRSRAEGGDAVASLLTNPGGPGASGISYVRSSLAGMVGEPVRQRYDTIGFDPRGVGESTAVRCYDAADMDEFLFGIPENPRGSDAWTAELTAAAASFAEACEAGSSGILEFITTENAARDMDLLRAVLGDSELHYVGYSYGTFLGATYAKLFPERVGRLVLDGAVDPSIPGVDVGATQAVGFESALRTYMADCLAGSECPFRGTVDEAMADLGALLASVDRRPLPASDGRQLGADSLNTAIVAALYAPSLWPTLTVALADTLAGDPTVAFLLADYYYDREDGVYLDNSTEAFMAYNCMDYPVDPDDVVDAAEARILAEAPMIAPYWLGPDPCEQWPFSPSGVREPITAAGAAPMLVVGTTGDPATPYEWAVSLADQLASGVLITRVGEGHTGYNKGNACVDDAVNAYLLDGVVPDGDVRCG